MRTSILVWGLAVLVVVTTGLLAAFVGTTTPDGSIDRDPGPDGGQFAGANSASHTGDDERTGSAALDQDRHPADGAGPDAGHSQRAKSRADAHRSWRTAQALVGDVDAWAAAGAEQRSRAAEAIGRRLPGFALDRLEVFSAGGASHQVAVFRHAGTGISFALIPGGTFTMGSPESEPSRHATEVQHQVTLSPFLMARTELSQAVWRATYGYVGANWEEDDRPMEQVRWSAAVEFCRKNGFRLPTEAEFEYACRAGTTTTYPWGDDFADAGKYAWTSAKGGTTHPVGTLRPNAFGLHDMLGNVWEWVSNRSGPYPDGPVRDPRGPDEGPHHVLRGGSWNDNRIHNRSAARLYYDIRGTNIGFRPVRDLPR